jgi:uncharacterized membrane protein (DUF2068 family)
MSEIPEEKTGLELDAKLDSPAGLLPGMAVIGLWMLAQCGIGLIGVIMHKLPMGALIICVIFALAANGLLKLKRWGWALTLGAAFLSMSYAVFMLLRFRDLPLIAMAVLNLIFFLYLIRPEVLERVK